METKANHLIVGIFVILVAALATGIVLWLTAIDVGQSTKAYRVYFTGSVAGLSVGSPVRFNGVPVGSVTDIRIDPDNIGRVETRIDIDANTPVRTDSLATMEPQGITGAFFVQITAGTHDAAPLTRNDGAIPIIPSQPSAIAEIFQNVPVLLARTIDVAEQLAAIMSVENQQAISDTLANVKTLSDALTASAVGEEGIFENVSAATQQIDALAGELRVGVAVITERAERTLTTVDQQVGAMGRDFNDTAEQLQALAGTLQSTATAIDGLVQETREPIVDFSTTGLYEFSLLITDLRQLANDVSRLANEVQRSPTDFLFGSERGTVEVE